MRGKIATGTLKKFCKVFLPTAIFFVLIIAIPFRAEVQSIASNLEFHDRAQIVQLAEVISEDFDAVVSDLLAIAENPALLTFIATQRDIDPVNDYFLSLAKHKSRYDQIRYIDETGMEAIRVNYNSGDPIIVPGDDLQMKGDRYYFTDSVGLDRGIVFVSPFDLNIEQGMIEQPLKPMLRFATPVFDSEGQTRGIVIINYLGAELMRHLDRVSTSPWSKVMLLNREGYWLKGENPEDEWGFMYDDDRQQNTFIGIYPEAWENISDAETGQFRTKDGLVTFTTIYPLREAWITSTGSPSPNVPSTRSLDGNGYFWKLIMFIPEPVWRNEVLASQNRYVLTTIGLWVVAFVTSVFLVRNMEQRAAAERTLRESEASYRSLVDISPETILVHIDGTIAYVNPAGAALFGASEPGELTGYSLNELVHPDFRDNSAVYTGRSESSEGEAPLVEMRHLRLDGRVIDTLVTARNVLYQGQNAIQVIILDVTERKQAEKSLLEIERTRGRILAEFISRASHEFRTPLSIINTSAYLLRKLVEPSQAEQHIQKIISQVDNIRALVEAMLLMSRLDREPTVDKEEFDLREWIEPLITNYQTIGASKHIQFNHNFQPDSLEMVGDSGKLQQAVDCILANAFAFTPEDGTISLDIAQRDEQVVIEVADTGIGIHESELQHIFERFYRSDKAGTRRGFGLGLAIAKKIVELHNGHITVESEPGQGSTFKIMLPRR